MPLAPFRHEADRVIRKCGRRYLTGQVDREYIEIIEEIAGRFKVSKTAVKIRLKQLGYIREAPQSNARFYYS
jgi:Zn-dependent peptidase ImmA (M78 family)